MPGHPFVLGTHHLPHLTASVEVKGPGERRTAGWILDKADAGMYQAKRSGKVRYDLYLDPAGESE